ncbi:uncharacterized protein DS421_17g591220 [Arachis hypogaea]|nr:uncharacterized protein DS421_17g591220 [Arachis hypogaea]
MEDSMQRYLFFAVTKETWTGVYTSWEDAREQVCNYPFLEFHGFNSYQQAVLAFNARLRCIATETATRLEMIGSSGEGSGVRKGSMPSRSSWPRPVVSWLPVIPEEELNGEFTIVNSMEDWLVKVCHESDIPGPCFFKQERYVGDKGPFFEFTMVVPGQPYEVELNAKGRFSMVERAAREDAAQEMLGQVLEIIGKEIKDYYYSRVKLLRDSNTALRAKVDQLEDAYEKLLASYEAVVNARIEGQSP